MGAYRQTLGDTLATPAAIPAGVRRRDGFHSLASIRCFAREDGEKLAPTGVIDRLVETRLAARSILEITTVAVWFRLGADTEVLALDGFAIDHIVLPHQGKRDFLVLLGERLHGLLAPFAAFLASGDSARRPLQCLLGFAVVARVGDEGAIGQRQKGLEAHVDACLLPGQGQRLRRHIGARKAGVPAINFSGDGDRLGHTLYRTMEANGDTVNLRKRKDTSIQARSIAILAIGKTVVAVPSLKP